MTGGWGSINKGFALAEKDCCGCTMGYSYKMLAECTLSLLYLVTVSFSTPLGGMYIYIYCFEGSIGRVRCVSDAAWVGGASATYALHTAFDPLKQVYRVTLDTLYALSKIFNNLFIHRRESQNLPKIHGE